MGSAPGGKHRFPCTTLCLIGIRHEQQDGAICHRIGRHVGDASVGWLLGQRRFCTECKCPGRLGGGDRPARPGAGCARWRTRPRNAGHDFRSQIRYQQSPAGERHAHAWAGKRSLDAVAKNIAKASAKRVAAAEITKHKHWRASWGVFAPRCTPMLVFAISRCFSTSGNSGAFPSRFNVLRSRLDRARKFFQFSQAAADSSREAVRNDNAGVRSIGRNHVSRPNPVCRRQTTVGSAGSR